MKQHDAVILTLEKLGGTATLAELYNNVRKVKDCNWKTKTPNESIRRIVQTRPNEIYKIKPGLYGLLKYKSQIENKGIIAETPKNTNSSELKESNHTYYQGLILQIGKFKGFQTFAPQQDKNKQFNTALKIEDIRTLKSIYNFSYPELVKRSSTIDAIWFNERNMPEDFFEVEFSPDFQNSLIKYSDLRDFNAKMILVSDKKQKENLDKKLNFTVFRDIRKRIEFWPYDRVILEYEYVYKLTKSLL
ncbi:MAG: hypothetical protein IT281_01700 [Ignavibacteria bacterium]|nr:hypothetical protein [Ignavibacteria bacterium]MCC7158232.1 hypothetical protein [Ignavibacteria bacterium]